MNRTPFRHGLVVGKFYPPHRGHEYVIQTAATHCKHVTVAVLGASVESIPVEQRVQWLQSSFADAPHVRVVGEVDDVPVDYHSATVWQAHEDIMRLAVRNADRQFGSVPPVDAVFTSESYGDELARRFGSAHVCLDPARHLYPTSGTAVRADIVSQWPMLPPVVQAGLTLRVVCVGAESTGTTTLSRAVVAALRQRGGVWQNTQWVPEYGREYSANRLALARAQRLGANMHDIDWCAADFVHVATQQCVREDAAARTGSPVLVCDTDAFATGVWHTRYLGDTSPGVAAITRSMPARGLYILTSELGVPFVDDGLRDGEQLRPWMTQRFRTLLQQQPAAWIEVTGTPQARCTQALAAIDAQAAIAWKFADPLG